MLGLAAISRMVAWHLPLPYPDGQVPGAPSWGNASPWLLPCLSTSVPWLQNPSPVLASSLPGWFEGGGEAAGLRALAAGGH